jgi:hypothetical protein
MDAIVARRALLRVSQPVIALVAASSFFGLLLAAAILVARRLSGGLSRPFDGPTWLALGVCLAMFLVAIREAGRRGFGEAARRPAVLWTPVAVALVIVVACWLPSTPSVGVLLGLIPIVVEEAWWVFRRRGRGVVVAPTVSTEVAPRATVAADVVQRLVRRTAEGVDELDGWLRADFPVGAKHATLHVAFCPPFNRSPKIVVRHADGATVSVKATQSLPHGARIELKRNVAAEAGWTGLQFNARAETE